MPSVRTRFAPSPTGFLHLGGARTALFAWAFARHHGGQFVLRIEDTDRERSTEAAIKAILDAMAWLGLEYDEGPFYQMQRLDRYRSVLDDLLARGLAYPCYMRPQELDDLRKGQMARGEKPRYDGRWRPENLKPDQAPPPGAKPVFRFKNPSQGEVGWDDGVKGRIEIANAELDDLVIMRRDGVPTYNFGVVVDDLDMRITHVIRGDDHVNNTPRQMNIIRALGGEVPVYAHLPTVLGADGTKLSKRHGAVSVMQYQEEGFLPEAMVNFLARLGWSHGDEEVFSREQLIEWFDLRHVSPASARFDLDKLRWVDHEHIKRLSDEALERELMPFLRDAGYDLSAGPSPSSVAALLRERKPTLKEIAGAAHYFYGNPTDAPERFAAMKDRPASLDQALRELSSEFDRIDWSREHISNTLKEVADKHGLAPKQFLPAVRTLVTGETQTPPLDVVLALLDRAVVRQRIAAALVQ